MIVSVQNCRRNLAPPGLKSRSDRLRQIVCRKSAFRIVFESGNFADVEIEARKFGIQMVRQSVRASSVHQNDLLDLFRTRHLQGSQVIEHHRRHTAPIQVEVKNDKFHDDNHLHGFLILKIIPGST